VVLEAELGEAREAIAEWADAVAHQNDDFDPSCEYEMDPGMERVVNAEQRLHAFLARYQEERNG